MQRLNNRWSLAGLSDEILSGYVLTEMGGVSMLRRHFAAQESI
jgi:hypothetical protein